MLFGYARVSSDDQNLDLQRDALKAAGCQRTFEDKAIGAQSERPALTALIDTSTIGGELVFHLFGAWVQFERKLIRERTQAGLSSARARGRTTETP